MAAIEIKPTYFYYDQLGFYYSYEGYHESSLSVYLEYLNNPETADKEKHYGALYTDIAIQYENLKNNDEAYRYYNLAVEQDQKGLYTGDYSPSYAYFKRGEFLIKKLGKIEEGLVDLKKAVEISPAYYLNRRGAFFHETKEYEKAAEDYVMAVKLAKENEEDYLGYLYELATNLSLSKDYSGAINTFIEILNDKNNEFDRSSLYNEIGYIYHDGLNDQKKAELNYLKGIEEDL